MNPALPRCAEPQPKRRAAKARRREDRSEAGGGKTRREEGRDAPEAERGHGLPLKPRPSGAPEPRAPGHGLKRMNAPPTKEHRVNMDEQDQQDGKQMRSYPVYLVHRCSISSPFPPRATGNRRGMISRPDAKALRERKNALLRIFPASLRLCASHLPPEICAAGEDFDGLWRRGTLQCDPFTYCFAS
jgi:hypothetical protein